jgi:transaldolase
MMNLLKGLQDYGQSVWLDYIRRHLITSGELQRLVEEDALRGLTSNPAIFEKAMTGSTDYAEALKALMTTATWCTWKNSSERTR